MTTLDHFASHAPLDVREALLSLANHSLDELASFKNSEACGEPELDEVWGKDPGGFIPFQLGGFRSSVLISCDADASYHLTEGMTDYANSQQEECLKVFLERKSKTSYDDLTEEEKEELWEDELEWLQPALLEFECWLDGEPYPISEQEEELGKVFLRISLNCADAPYYRSKYAETLYELSLSVEVLRETVARWPDDWQARLWRQLLAQEGSAQA